MQKFPLFIHSALIRVDPSTDRTIVRPFLLIAITAAVACAESHPTWWTYASPEATALVGIQWNNLRHSPFAAAVDAEISSTGPLAFPDLACLKQAREIVISSPPLLAAEAGTFPAALVKDQAQQLGLRRTVYRGLTLWLPEKASGLGVAQVSEQLLLVGTQNALKDSIDRSLLETGRMYSPLLPKAARFAQTGDLWVVAANLPDPLASLFVPLDVIPSDAEASEFLGQVSVRNGLAVEGSFDAGSPEAAAKLAKELRERAPSFPPVARGLETATAQNRVTIALQVTTEQLSAALHPVPAPAAPVATNQIANQRAALIPAPAVATPQAPASAPVTFEITHVESSQPQIIRIFGLDEGPREIVLQP